MNFMLLTSDFLTGLDNVESGLDSASNSFSSIYEIFLAIAGILGIGIGGLTAVSGFIVTTVVSIVSFLVVFFGWLLPSIALFRMGKKAGYKHSWLAFIPVVQTYVEFVIPRRKFNVGIIRTYKRDIIGIIYIILCYIGTSLVAILNSFVGLGQILDIAFFIFMQAILWRRMYDLIRTYSDKELAMIVSIVSLFVPIVYPIALLFNMNKEPEYGKGNYYNVLMGKDEKEISY